MCLPHRKQADARYQPDSASMPHLARALRVSYCQDKKRTMMKIVKIIGLVVGVLLLILAAGAAYLAATFDPNDYKPTLIKYVQDHKQRTLAIPGNVSLTFFPSLGAELGPVSLSERNNNDVFAAVESAHVSFALMPLLSRQLVVEKMSIDGLRANIIRKRDGELNTTDLLDETKEGPESSSDDFVFDIAGIDVRNAELTYEDQAAGARYSVRELNLKTGKIADATPSQLTASAQIVSSAPELDVRMDLSTAFTLHLAQGRYQFNAFDVRIKGMVPAMNQADLALTGDLDLYPSPLRFSLEKLLLTATGQHQGAPFVIKLDAPQLAVTDAKVSGGKVNGEFAMTQGERKINAYFRLPSLQGSPQALNLPALELEASVVDRGLTARGLLSGAFTGDFDKGRLSSSQLTLNFSGKQGDTPLQGALSTPMAIDLQAQTVSLPKLAVDMALPNPGGGALLMKAAGDVQAALDKETVKATLNGNLDQSPFKARLGLDGFSDPKFDVDIDVTRLDVDRYSASASKAPAAPAGKSASKDPNAPFDLSALKQINGSGKLRVGTLKVAGMSLADVRVTMNSQAGKLDLNPFSASLYGGNVRGAAGVDVSGSGAPGFTIKQTLNGVNVATLLKDAIDSDRLEGRGSVQLDLHTTGSSLAQLQRGLNGDAQINLRDGAIRGINIAQSLRKAKSSLDALRGKEAGQAGTGSNNEKTDFSELSGSFVLKNGVAHNDDLELKSPLLRVAGAGNIDVGAMRLDYLARVTVVGSLKGQGGPELESLKGLTLPVKLSGPLDAIAWNIDGGTLIKELARQKLEPKTAEVKERINNALDEEKAKLKDNVKEQLRGLFGR